MVLTTSQKMDAEVLQRLVEQQKIWFGAPAKPFSKHQTKEESTAEERQKRMWAEDSFGQLKSYFAEVVSALEAAGYKDLKLDSSENKLELQMGKYSCTINVRPNELYTFETELHARLTAPRFSWTEERYFCTGSDLWKFHPWGQKACEDAEKEPTQNALDKENTKYTSSSLVERFISILQGCRVPESP